jgi:uncharacterized protein (TIGR00288 family)
MIDFDNVTLGIRSDLQNQLRRLLNSEIIKGKVSVQRAYADWRRYPQYIVPLSEASIDLIFAPAFGSNKKNATDIRLAIDALELVFTRPEIGVFILLSGDSDFSSLVLKLKEYGKYVIGVGIRESSSDLLIQNCDEYYSYNELTGLSKEGELQAASLDPWELVVQAVVQMKQEDDVMRSDRLKQVMQSIDPSFDEKEAGFSRFSKFVIEAQKRGLLSLTKLENGQFAIDVGTNANVSPEQEKEFRHAETPAGVAERRERRSRRGGRSRERAPAVAGGLTLADGFDLLRRALRELGAVDEAAADAEVARTKMMDLSGASDDPIFERPRFFKLIRQAHDANVIELIKQDEDTYLMKLAAGAAVEVEPVEDAVEPRVEAPAEDERPRRRGGRRERSSGRRGRGASRREEEPPVPTSDDVGEAPPASRAETREQAEARARRNPRYRRGSRGGPPPRPGAGAPEVSDQRSPEAAPESGAGSGEAMPMVRGARSVGPRRGSRGAAPARPAAESDSAREVPAGPVPEPQVSRTPVVEVSRREIPAEAAPPTEADEGGGLLKRMSAALQKVMRGSEDTPPPGA